MSKAKKQALEAKIVETDAQIKQWEGLGIPDAGIDSLRALRATYQNELDTLPKTRKKGTGGGKRKNKYNASQVIYNGITYHSKREALMAYLLDVTEISYTGQVRHELIPKHTTANGEVQGAAIIVDFEVPTTTSTLVIDVKGVKTPVSKLKYKLFQFQNLETHQCTFPSTDEECIRLAEGLSGMKIPVETVQHFSSVITKPEPPAEEAPAEATAEVAAEAAK